jgi:hypothetical protein
LAKKASLAVQAQKSIQLCYHHSSSHHVCLMEVDFMLTGHAGPVWWSRPKRRPPWTSTRASRGALTTLASLLVRATPHLRTPRLTLHFPAIDLSPDVSQMSYFLLSCSAVLHLHISSQL